MNAAQFWCFEFTPLVISAAKHKNVSLTEQNECLELIMVTLSGIYTYRKLLKCKFSVIQVNLLTSCTVQVVLSHFPLVFYNCQKMQCNFVEEKVTDTYLH